MRLSIIIPALNEAATLPVTLAALDPLRRRGVEVILADGGSVDGTVEAAKSLVDRISVGTRGRARQMNAGAKLAHGDVLLFLHADSLLPSMADQAIQHELADEEVLWGRFDVNVSGDHAMLPVIAWFINRRSRLTGIATGDQGIFVRRKVFERLSGFADIGLMEDVEFSKRLVAISRPACLSVRITTSGRRWETHGVWRTIWLMWSLRWRYWRGESPDILARTYRTVGASKGASKQTDQHHK
jgi:rSAM/selenodomain-associated transferase 2